MSLASQTHCPLTADFSWRIR